MNYPRESGFLLMGEDISKEQAAQILIRTLDLKTMNFKDENWGLSVFRTFGIPLRTLEDRFDESFDKYFRLSVLRYRMLADSRGYSYLEFFGNCQVNHIPGPYGWCSWEGKLSANSYNILNYPFEEGILEEWSRIAKAFPFLKIRFQMLDGPVEMPSSRPLQEYHIEGGKVQKKDPDPFFPVEYSPSFSLRPKETTIDLEDLKQALELCA